MFDFQETVCPVGFETETVCPVGFETSHVSQECKVSCVISSRFDINIC